MNSHTIEQAGFTKWINIRNTSACKNLPSDSVVYVFKHRIEFGRLKGSSDILYIGETTDLNFRINENYLGGRGGKTTQRLRQYLIQNYLDTTQLTYRNVVVGERKNLQNSLLSEYERDHHELPPWNRQGV